MYFAGQASELQTLVFGSGRDMPSQNSRLTFPPFSSIHAASDIYTEQKDNIVTLKLFSLRESSARFAVMLLQIIIKSTSIFELPSYRLRI